MIVQNLPVPFDRRVWLEATTLVRAGYVVSVISPKGRGYDVSEETIDGVHIHRHSLPAEKPGGLTYVVEYSLALFWELFLAVKISRRRGFDVIHACNPPDLIFLVGSVFKFLLGTRFVFDQHDVNPELYEAKFGRHDVLWWLLRQAERLTFKAADICLATNDSFRRIAIERGHKRPKDVFVVRTGPNLDRMMPRSPNSRWRNGRAHMVGYVGVISEIEGLDLLLASVEFIVRERRRDDIQFVIVGNGPQWNAITTLCKEKRLEDWVTFTGRVEDNLLFEILSTADLCVNPDRVSSMSDISTMNKVMEYMAFGKAIVQFDVKEGRYSAGDASAYAKANDPIDFAEKLLDLVDDPLLRKRMGQFGRRRVTEVLSWERQQPALIAAYDSVFRLPKDLGLFGRLRRLFTNANCTK